MSFLIGERTAGPICCIDRMLPAVCQNNKRGAAAQDSDCWDRAPIIHVPHYYSTTILKYFFLSVGRRDVLKANIFTLLFLPAAARGMDYISGFEGVKAREGARAGDAKSDNFSRYSFRRD